MPRETAARRYARALLEIAQEEGALERFEGELTRIAELLDSNGDLRQVLLNPVFEADARKRIVRELAARLEVGPLVTNFLCLLLDKRKLARLPEIARIYRELVDRAAGRIEAQLVAAAALDGDLPARIADELSKWTGKQVRLKTKVDPELIGGVVARIDGLVLDGSLRTQIEELRERLAKG